MRGVEMNMDMDMDMKWQGEGGLGTAGPGTRYMAVTLAPCRHLIWALSYLRPSRLSFRVRLEDSGAARD